MRIPLRFLFILAIFVLEILRYSVHEQKIYVYKELHYIAFSYLLLLFEW